MMGEGGPLPYCGCWYDTWGARLLGEGGPLPYCCCW